MKLYRYACDELSPHFAHNLEYWHENVYCLTNNDDYFDYVLEDTDYLVGVEVRLESITLDAIIKSETSPNPSDIEDLVEVENTWTYVNEPIPDEDDAYYSYWKSVE